MTAVDNSAGEVDMDNDFLWWRDGVIYQIYPRSFVDSNADGIGDLQGIRSKLDYLQGLGIDAIWLSPIFPSPDVDFGYDVSNYLDIDPKFGTLEEFQQLVEDCHQRGIRVILDLVLNHTSDQHPWFVESRSSRDNPKNDWYLWKDPSPNGGPPNNWQSVFGGSGWEYEARRGQYYFHMFYKEQPDVNWRNPAVREELVNVFRFWAERGVDGFRLDVFNDYFKDAGFRDNPAKLGLRPFDRQQHIHDVSQPEMMPLLKEIRSVLDSYPQRYAVGETFLGEDQAKTAASYCGSERLHAAFNFSFTHCKWDAGQFLRAIQHWENSLGDDAWPTYVLNNHDVRRSASRYARGEDDRRLKVAAAMLLTLRGTPYLYYGEEIGMRDIKVGRSEIQDPIGKHYWPFFIGRDGCRSPMQWNAAKHAGFSQATPWLKVNPNHATRNVESQQNDPRSLYHFYRNLIQLRKDLPALRQGMFLPLVHEPRYILAYLRQTQTQTVLVALNFSRRRLPLMLSGRMITGQPWKLALSSREDARAELSGTRLDLAPYEASIYAVNE
ncbi:alpha-glucosidase [Ornatilinea apprima]|nr:alpha-glucosidase [Ornatilinea apprima]